MALTFANNVAVTKKKARYEGFSWESLETHGILELETTKGIFAFTHAVGPEFSKAISDSTTAKALKAKAAAAKGLTGADAELQSLEGFMAKHFTDSAKA